MGDDTILTYSVCGINADYSKRRQRVRKLDNLVADVSQTMDDVAPHFAVVSEIQSPYLIARVQQNSARSFAGHAARLQCDGSEQYDRLGLLVDETKFEETKFEVNEPQELEWLRNAKCLAVPLRDTETRHDILLVGCHLPHRYAKLKYKCCELMRNAFEELSGSYHSIIVCGDFNMRRPYISERLGVSEDRIAFSGIDNVVVYNSDVVKFWEPRMICASDRYSHAPITVKVAFEC